MEADELSFEAAAFLSVYADKLERNRRINTMLGKLSKRLDEKSLSVANDKRWMALYQANSLVSEELRPILGKISFHTWVEIQNYWYAAGYNDG